MDVTMNRLAQWAISAVTLLLNRTVRRASPDGLVTRISVLASGKILLNGRAATISEVRRALEKVKTDNGTVWFYRESGKEPPHLHAIDIFKLIVETKVPTHVSSKADFSD
jgi:hypothetical protein